MFYYSGKDTHKLEGQQPDISVSPKWKNQFLINII